MQIITTIYTTCFSFFSNEFLKVKYFKQFAKKMQDNVLPAQQSFKFE